MNSLTVFDFNSNNIRFKNRNGRVWVNLTDMAKASGKKIDNWKRLESTGEFLIALEQSLTSEVMVSNVGGLPETTGTWAIEEVALEFAGWCSVQFKIWMLTQIKTLITQGYVALPQAEPVRQLPQRDVVEYVNSSKYIDTVNNLTLQQLLRDELIDELSVKRGIKQLAAAPKEYTIVKVRAKELGYTTTDIGNGSSLGKFVCKLVPIAFEERVGKYSVKHYEVNDQLDTAIKSYFGMRHALK